MRLLISGAGGFLGSALLNRLAMLPENEVTGIYRSAPLQGPILTKHATLIGNLDAKQDWRAIPRGCDALIHCAARVHLLSDTAADPLSEYRKVNVDGTLHLARQAAEAGVRRFVFISTIKVNGERTPPGGSFSADDAPAPSDPYGVSKWEAEQGLRQIAAQTAMDVVVIRPPLVYGPGVRGNFRAMLRWLQRGLPLPLGAIRNRRSLVYRDNLIDLIVRAIDHPAAANHTFLVSDGEDMSTPELLRRTGRALGRPARLIPLPRRILEACSALMGKPDAVSKLCDSLCIDMAKTCRLLDWQPAISVEKGLRETAESYLLETRA